jgi:hypothetical protein
MAARNQLFLWRGCGFGAFEGVKAIRSFLEDWFGAFEDYRVDARRPDREGRVA